VDIRISGKFIYTSRDYAIDNMTARILFYVIVDLNDKTFKSLNVLVILKLVA